MCTLETLRKELERRGLSPYFEALSPFARHAVTLKPEPCADAAVPVGSSKFGGLPDLPAGAEWFRHPATGMPLSFLAQINFAEVSPYDTARILPERGMLYLFYDCSCDGMPWGFDPGDSGGWKVFFYNGDLSALTRRDAPSTLENEDNGMIFGAARLGFEAGVEIPSPESDLTNGLALPDDDELQDAYWEWLDEQGEDGLRSKLLGHADPIQGGMELECEYVTHGIYCGTPEGYRTAKARGLDKNAGRWCLLMQLDSHEDLGMMWGDVGRLYLWIPADALAARDFDRCWLVLQCG